MLVMTYSKWGMAVNDWGVEDLFEVLVASSSPLELRLEYSTANIFHRVRLGIARGEISHRQVAFMFEGESISVNELSACLVWQRVSWSRQTTAHRF